jgi:hypothetical protein
MIWRLVIYELWHREFVDAAQRDRREGMRRVAVLAEM